jgi:HAD superfamily hydrolase (TIGR01549 family)
VNIVRAVLFDLDDTLFDHFHGSRRALEAVRRCHECFAAVESAELERSHTRFLDELHAQVMLGRMPLEAAREERFRRLFRSAGLEADDELVRVAARAYRDSYREARRAIQGAAALLPLVKARARLGIVTNNLLEEQQEKLRVCGLDAFVDVLVVSEEAGVAKPDAGIFALALERLGCAAHEAVMVGDSWPVDVVGARAAGIRPIWFNRHHVPAPEGDTTVLQLHALEPAEAVLRVIFDAHRD